MSKRLNSVTTTYVKVSDGSRRIMVTPSGDIRISDTSDGAEFAMRAAGKDFFTPMGKATFVRAETGTVTLDMIG